MRKYLVGGGSYDQSGQRVLLLLVHQFGAPVFELNPRFLRLDEDGLEVFVAVGEVLKDSDALRVLCDDIEKDSLVEGRQPEITIFVDLFAEDH